MCPKMMDDNYNPPTGKKRTWDQFASKYKWKQGYNAFRLYGLVWTDARHDNIATKSGSAYNEYCHGYDVDNDKFFDDRGVRCACCALDMQTKIRHFVNVLSVDEWENRPAKPGPDWNPFYLLELSDNLHGSIVKLRAHRLNTSRSAVGDLEKGSLISIEYDKNAPSPAQIYSGVSIIQSPWKFDEEMLKFTFFQSTPDGTREVRKANGGMPAAWTYYPCRSTKEDMRSSLSRNGYYAKEQNVETNSKVEAKAQALLSEVNSLMEGAATPAKGVAQLAKLREDSNGVDASPPPPAVAAAAKPADDTLDEIPF